ncbi:hypothetical protein BLNAU_17520 [Blattamonas nauphoetae]|uniref:Uncharacterized protein n=1 Tax=Blattamonas nauphoetae TaxID=2049346 RepID=A0ABQ9X7D1_9EUKA|nr:hypothetical protein BLNAU_17520 [Blattamonas nauphoetae]
MWAASASGAKVIWRERQNSSFPELGFDTEKMNKNKNSNVHQIERRECELGSKQDFGVPTQHSIRSNERTPPFRHAWSNESGQPASISTIIGQRGSEPRTKTRDANQQ